MQAFQQILQVLLSCVIGIRSGNPVKFVTAKRLTKINFKQYFKRLTNLVVSLTNQTAVMLDAG